jgi:thiamine biosynthesis lipoprotein
MKLYLPKVFVLICTLFLNSCSREKPMERLQFLMGTYARVNVFGGTEKDIDAGFSKIRDLDNLLSDYKPDSQISQINRSSGKTSVEVSDEVKEVIQAALGVAEETKGVFDPTIGALTISLYHFGRGNESVPTEGEIEKAKTLVNYRWVRIDGNRVFLEKEGMVIDLGGIRKGFAVDKAVDVLKKRGIKKGLVSISGVMRAFGGDWLVGIKHPRGEGAIVAFNTGGRDLAISTSGDYERYVEKDSKAYHHLLNPKSGKSAGDFQSITVIMEGNNTLADAYASSLFVMGKQQALEFVDNHSEIGAFMVFSNGEVFYNDKFKRLVVFKN